MHPVEVQQNPVEVHQSLSYSTRDIRNNTIRSGRLSKASLWASLLNGSSEFKKEEDAHRQNKATLTDIESPEVDCMVVIGKSPAWTPRMIFSGAKFCPHLRFLVHFSPIQFVCPSSVCRFILDHFLSSVQPFPRQYMLILLTYKKQLDEGGKGTPGDDELASELLPHSQGSNCICDIRALLSLLDWPDHSRWVWTRSHFG